MLYAAHAFLNSLGKPGFTARVIMVAAVFLFLFIYLLFCRPVVGGGISDGSYLSRERTCTINALMIASVFISHSANFIGHAQGQIAPLEGWDHVCSLVVCRMGQLMVSTFFLFSGYGIMESMRKKGNSYLAGFLGNRFWKVFYQFELGILCYYAVALIWGESFSLTDVLLGLTGWRKLGGNPTWYIVVTLVMYLVAYVSLHFTGKRRWCVMAGLVALVYAFFAFFRANERWWYDTMFCFPAGMLLSCYRHKLEAAIAWTRIPAPLLGLLLVLAVYIPPNVGILAHPLVYNFKAIVFAYGMALLWSAVHFQRTPKLLMWLGGSALFCFYFYHILVFKIVLHYSPVPLTAEAFMAICLPLSLGVAWLALKVHAFLDARMAGWWHRERHTALR